MTYLRLFPFLVTLLVLNSCCQQKDCIGANDINEIELHNFTADNVDSILITTYLKNSDLCSLIDSFYYTARSIPAGDSIFIVELPNKLNMDLDYKLYFKNINQTYLLTDFSTKKIECNSCFPFGHDYVPIMDNYLVNGQKQIMSNLQITK